MTTSLLADKESKVIRITREMYQDFYVLSEMYNVSVSELIKNIIDESVVLSVEE